MNNETLKSVFENNNKLENEVDVENHTSFVTRDHGLELISETATLLAHEIRNPISSIKLATGILREKLLDAELSKVVKIIETACENVDDIIEHIMFFHKARRLTLRLVNIRDAILSAIHAVSELETVEVQFEAPAFCYLYADEKALQRITYNVVSNSLKAVQRVSFGKRIIKIHVKNDEDKVILNIVDNGGGFPDGYTTDSIKPFRSYFSRGTGLGLSVVNELVVAHGGYLRLQNIETKSEVWAWVQIVFFKNEASSNR